jgi:cytochrome c5
MTIFKLLPPRGWTIFGALLMGRLASAPCFADSPTGALAPTNSVAAKAVPRVAKTKLTGAELYSIHCNRCHPERYPTERTAANWKTIMLHMQVRANIPGQQSRLILQYLQENSGR